ncbi:hypothetical protein [Aliiruegeria sabulilitoris]|uniref:hypothetical protein n=1 Tax=Aliiruegeria sabulilitoris TaxID=1510458 RepID=UPI000831B450|nr:hypothetical protein [Aliiruegeria sabulilitoris]NDR57030.1 hypothetical protein [Pseudoruegeria sp. M32A2M]
MDLFAHRIHNAEYVNGVVRLECSIIRPDEKGEYHPDSVKAEDTTFTVNLPLQGFMRSIGVMRELFKKLQEDGTIKGQGGEGGRAGGAPGGGQGGGNPRGQGGPGGPRGGQGQSRPQLNDLSEENRSDDDDHLV